MTKPRVIVVSISGGKDSTATALVARELNPNGDIRYVFADTGNEHPSTYDYVLNYLPTVLGKIDVVRANFDKEIAARRTFVARDARGGRRYRTKEVDTGRPELDAQGAPTGRTVKRDVKIGGGVRVRHTNKAKRRILAMLQPTGNPYLDLCLWKGRFPSRRAQFCTQHLKTIPLTEYQLALMGDDVQVESWQGVRADESPRRALLEDREDRGGGLIIERPILRWNVDQVFAKMREHGVTPNPLYLQGMSRVGCMPCINAAKAEVKEISRRFPEQIDRIGEWELAVRDASKRNGASFFPAPDDGRGELRGRDIYAVVEWSKKARGGRQHQFEFEDEPAACASAYGLCE